MHIRRERALKSPIGKQSANQGKTHYFEKLCKADLIEELNAREVTFCSLEPKSSLQQKLEATISGVQRVPALLFSSPESSLTSLGLERYEITACEPLHCVSNHIKNIYEELPSHLIKEERMEFQNAITTSFRGKEAKRASDYRLSLLRVTTFLQGKINENALKILRSLSEIQQILYSPEERLSSELYKIC